MRLRIALSVVLGLLGLLVISWLVIQADPPTLAALLSKVHPDWLAAAFLSTLVWLGFRALRWQNIMRTADIDVSFKVLYQITLVGLLVDFMTPIYRAGSEPLRTYLLNKYFKIESGRGIATIMVDRFFDFVIFLSLAVIALALLLPKFGLAVQIGMFVSVVGLIGALVTLVYLSINTEAAYRFIKRFVRLAKKVPALRGRMRAWEGKIRAQVEVYAETVRHGFFLNTTINALLSIILIALEIIRMQLLVLALGVQLDLFWIIVTFGAIVIAGIIPSPPGGVGIVEPIGIGALLFAGLNVSQATSLIFLDRIVTMVFISLLGLWTAYNLGVKFGKKAGPAAQTKK